MFEFDATLTLTGVVALTAIVSPVIVTIMNNHHAYKMKKLEIKHINQSQAFENYMLAVGSILDEHSSQTFRDYEARKCLAYIQAPRSAWREMDKLDKLIKERKFNDARKVMADVGKVLSQE